MLHCSALEGLMYEHVEQDISPSERTGNGALQQAQVGDPTCVLVEQAVHVCKSRMKHLSS
jgi:hypothetical protein